MPTQKVLKGRRKLSMLLNSSSDLCHLPSCLSYTILLWRKQVCTNTNTLWVQSRQGAQQQSLQGDSRPLADAGSRNTVFLTSELSPGMLGITLTVQVNHNSSSIVLKPKDPAPLYSVSSTFIFHTPQSTF